MSDDQSLELDRLLSRLGALTSFFRFGVWFAFGILSAILAIAGWVFHVNSLQAQTNEAIVQFQAEHKELRGWQGKKDEIDVRLTTTVEVLAKNQERMLRLLEQHALTDKADR